MQDAPARVQLGTRTSTHLHLPDGCRRVPPRPSAAKAVPCCPVPWSMGVPTLRHWSSPGGFFFAARVAEAPSRSPVRTHLVVVGSDQRHPHRCTNVNRGRTPDPRHKGPVTIGEELLDGRRRRRPAGDPRLSAEGLELFSRRTAGDLVDEFQAALDAELSTTSTATACSASSTPSSPRPASAAPSPAPAGQAG